MSELLYTSHLPNTPYSSSYPTRYGFITPEVKRPSTAANTSSSQNGSHTIHPSQNFRPTTSSGQSTAAGTPITKFTLTPPSSSPKKIWSSINRGPFLPGKSSKHTNKKTLVLDMDETLLHASGIPVRSSDFIITLSDGVRFYCTKRPHLDQFLKRMSELYEVVVYTSGEKEYATTIINEVDPLRYISYILHRDHCIHTRRGMEKDLQLIGRDLKDVIFIDNLEENMKRQIENGIKISDFYSDRKDNELNKLIPFLEYASKLDDVRPIRKMHREFLLRKIEENQQDEQQKLRNKSSIYSSSSIFNNRRGSLNIQDIKETPKSEGKLNQSMCVFSNASGSAIQDQSTLR